MFHLQEENIYTLKLQSHCKDEFISVRFQQDDLLSWYQISMHKHAGFQMNDSSFSPVNL